MYVCLMFHGLGTPPAELSADEKRYWTGVERFRQILDLVARAPNRIRLTFDDGNDSDVKIALPLLREAQLNATFFVIANRIGLPRHTGEDDIRALHAAGMAIGSHGCDHVAWTELSGDVIAEVVTRSFARLSAILTAPPDSVAVPFGACDTRVARVLRGLGLDRVYTSFHGPTLDSDWLVRRECITADTPMHVIEDWLTRHYNAADVAYSFLRTARHVRHAALWRTT
jgi:peptidoglycan/xylan/chitin deacetylase (PgdA/CDA1 family)